MEKQLEILKALLDGKAVYDASGAEVGKEDRDIVQRSVSLLTSKLSLTPPHKPLTFERIKKECVSGKQLLVDKKGNKRLFIGFNRSGGLTTDDAYGYRCIPWSEAEIKDWTIEEYK